MKNKVAIIGVGNTIYTSLRRETRSKAELAFDAISRALEMVNITIRDIDATVFTSVDGFEGNVRPCRTLEAFGQAHNIPLIDVNTGGTAGSSGIKEAVHLISAGIHELVLVYGSPTFAEVVDNQQVLNTAAPPIFEKPFGVGAAHMGALYPARYMREHNFTAEDFALVAAKNHKDGANNPFGHLKKGFTQEEVLASPMVAWPLHLYEMCPVSSGSVAVIFASEGKARELSDTPVWIKAISSIADTFLTGYKSYKELAQLKIVAQRVYEMAGIKNPREEIQVAELFNAYAPLELMQCEALDFCGTGEGVKILRDGVTSMGGDLPINPSGSVLTTNSGISASVSRHAEVALQIMGQAEGRQVEPTPEVGLAHSLGGNMMQFETVAILSR